MHLLQTRIASRLFPSSLRTLGALVGLLATAGCFGGPSTPTFGPGEPLAAGSTTTLQLFVPGTIDHMTSSDPSIVAMTGSYPTSVAAGVPGTARLTAYDASNAVIAIGTIAVAGTSSIGLDFTPSASGYAILVGSHFAVHATTLAADGTTLTGDGAIQFAFTGAVTEDTSTSAVSDCGGDCAAFEALAPGEGQLVMTASSSVARTVVPIHVVTAIDSFSVAQASIDLTRMESTYMPISVTAGGLPAWTPVACRADDLKMVTALVDPMLGPVLPPTQLHMIGATLGSTRVTCSAGTLTQSFIVNVK